MEAVIMHWGSGGFLRVYLCFHGKLPPSRLHMTDEEYKKTWPSVINLSETATLFLYGPALVALKEASETK